MKRLMVPLLLLGLGACQDGGVWANVPVDDTPDGRACRTEAENDPDIRRLGYSSTGGVNPSHDERVRQEMLEALPRAWRTCMMRRGAIPQGGVERVNRTRF